MMEKENYNSGVCMSVVYSLMQLGIYYIINCAYTIYFVKNKNSTDFVISITNTSDNATENIKVMS